MFKKLRDVQYYIDIIDGAEPPPKKIPSDYVEEGDKNFLDFAFDQISEIAIADDAVLLEKYIQGDIDSNNPKKHYALISLGYFSDSRFEDKIKAYQESKAPDLRFISYCSLCEMYIRDALSSKFRAVFESYLISLVEEMRVSNEDLIECALALKKSGYSKIDSIFSRIESSRPEIMRDIESFL